MGPPHPAAAEGARRGRSPPALGGCGGNGHPHEAAVGRRVCHVASLAQRRADRTQTLSNLNPSSALIYLGGARHLPFTSATIFQSPLARCFSFLGKFLFFSPSFLASFRSSYVKSAAVFRSLLQVAVRPSARRLRSPRCNPRRSVDARPAAAPGAPLCSFPGTSSTRCQAPPRTDDGDSGDNQVAAAAAGGVVGWCCWWLPT